MKNTVSIWQLFLLASVWFLMDLVDMNLTHFFNETKDEFINKFFWLFFFCLTSWFISTLEKVGEK